MGLFSGWKPKTIAGKILKGVVTIGAPVAAAVTGVGAVVGAISGVGAVAGAVAGVSKVAGVVKGGFTATGRVIDTVSTAATNLVTGTTKEQREIIKEQKKENRADIQKVNAIEKLINAGASVKEAAAKIGVPLAQLAGMFGLPSEGDQLAQYTAETKDTTIQATDKNKMLMYAAAGLAALFLLPKIFKGR